MPITPLYTVDPVQDDVPWISDYLKLRDLRELPSDDAMYVHQVSCSAKGFLILTPGAKWFLFDGSDGSKHLGSMLADLILDGSLYIYGSSRKPILALNDEDGDHAFEPLRDTLFEQKPLNLYPPAHPVQIKLQKERAKSAKKPSKPS